MHDMTPLKRLLLVVMVALLVLGSLVLARTGKVTTTEGQSFTGEVRETEKEVIITIHGVETVIQRENVASVQYLEDWETEFLRKLEALNPNDVAGRVRLAREAFDARRYVIARDVLEEALKIDPRDTEALTMMETVRRQIRLEETRRPVAPRPVAPPDRLDADPDAPPPALGVRQPLPTLSDAQIQEIRRRELTPADVNIRVRFEPNVIREFAESQGMTFQEFNRLPTLEKAMRIIDRGTPEMVQRVQIMQDPQVLATYRRTIQPLILNGCASSGCHGGPQAGNFRLIAPADNDAATYTNFFLLQDYTRKVGRAEGIFGTGATRMITRGQGDQSLLAQYMLPPTISDLDHPQVPGYTGLARSRQDPRYQQVVAWINSLTRVAPNYQFDFRLPATQPAN